MKDFLPVGCVVAAFIVVNFLFWGGLIALAIWLWRTL